MKKGKTQKHYFRKHAESIFPNQIKAFLRGSKQNLRMGEKT